MAAGSNLQIFSWIYRHFDGVLTSYISENASAIASAIAPTAWIMFAIYVILWGISMVRGLIEEPVTDGLMRLVKIALVMTFALNVGRYQSDVVEFFMKTPDAMASVLAFRDQAAGDQSTYGTIDTLLNKTLDTARKAWDKGGVINGNVGMYLAAIFIVCAGLFFTISAGVMIIIAKIAMVMLLALGPLFILMLMFKPTQRFFEVWLSQVINYMILLVLLLAVCTMFFELVERAIEMAEGIVDQSTLEAVATVCTVTIACSVLLFQVSPIASALAGGVALPVGQVAKRLSGGGAVDAVGDAFKRRAANKVVDVALAKATGGASLAVNAVRKATGATSTMYRASNTIRRG